MHRRGWLALGALLVAGSARCGYPSFVFDGSGGASTTGRGGAGGGSGSSSSSSTASSSGGPTCASVDGAYGCCEASDTVLYCNDGMTVMTQMCFLGDVCGWDPSKGYYDCGSPPGVEDPSHPMACGP
jgi:hypothetical protein